MNLSTITHRKFIESYPGNGRRILTPDGYKEILEVHKTIPYRKYKIILRNGLFLEGAFNHVIITENGDEIYIKDSLNSMIKTELGLSEVIDVIDLEIEENMYDISINSEDELFYSNGILSHNSGKSVTVGIYLCWLALFEQDVNIGIAAQQAEMSKEFLNKVKEMFITLPIWLTPGVNVWNKKSIAFENGVRLLSDVAGSNAFRGFTISYSVTDEAAYISGNDNGTTKFNAYLDSMLPSQSALAKKKNIFISTANGRNEFCHLYEGAKLNGTDENNKPKPGNNGSVAFTTDWKEVPRWNQDGTPKSPEQFKDEVVASKGELFFQQAYGNSFLGSSLTLISTEAISAMKSKEPVLIKDNMLKIYEEPKKGHQYIMAIDPSKDGKDAFAIQIVDITNFNFIQVASAKIQIDYLLMPEYIDEYCKYYNNPYLIIENNEGAGQSIADQMYQTYEYENLHFDKTDNKRKKYPGTRTTTKTRKQILQTMKTFIENNNLKINDADTIDEMYTFILINNKYQASDGNHDDMIMSLALIFTLFNNVRNFEDMKKITDILKTELEEREEVKADELITVGGFDDGTLENELYNSYDNSYEEYVVNLNYNLPPV